LPEYQNKHSGLCLSIHYRFKIACSTKR
jgi:hypothetical protein